MAFAIDATAEPRWLADTVPPAKGPSLRRVAVLSLLTVVFGFGGVLFWAGHAKLESAVPASGTFIASGQRKTITLADGGILRELLVREGDHVRVGQMLLKLDNSQALAARNQAFIQYWAGVAKSARLDAEAADKRIFPVAEDLSAAAAAEPAVAAALSAEQHQFEVRWAALDGSVRVQERKIAQTQAQMGATRAQIASAVTQLDLVREELHSVSALLARGLETKPHLLGLLAKEADLRGQIGQFGNQLIQAQQSIAQTELEIINTAQSRRADITRDLADTQAQKADAEQRLRAATDLLATREVKAPEDGTITDLKFFTIGSAIAGGQPVMDLVPATNRVLLEANVSPRDVEHLAIGQRVNIRLSSYKAHLVPVVTGHLTYVGADRQMDANNQAYFLVRAEVDQEALHGREGVVLLPGMPADVLIVNGSRSLLSFLISPITDSLFSAMKEK